MSLGNTYMEMTKGKCIKVANTKSCEFKYNSMSLTILSRIIFCITNTIFLFANYI